ncbi:MAG: hypothetical protein ACJ71W_21920 [Terriglobales bacterium]
MTALDLHTLLSGYQLSSPDESTLQLAIAHCLDLHRVTYEREVRLNADDRPDFMVGDVAIEVKVGGSASAVLRQLHRYAQHDCVKEILLVSTLVNHIGLTESFNGKPVIAFFVGRSFL